MESYRSIKRRLLKDPQTSKAYEALGSEFILAQSIIEKRLEKGLTQAALARKMNTHQSAIARLESGTSNPTLAFVAKAAHALDAQLDISLS